MSASAEKIKKRLIEIAKQRDEPFGRTQTLFFLECAASRLIKDPILEKHLVFKGGLVTVKIYGSPRFTTDLDATAFSLSSDTIKDRVLKALETDQMDSLWFAFEGIEDTAHQGDYGGIRYAFRTGFKPMPKSLRKTQIVNIDIGIGDPVTPFPRLAETNTSLEEGSIRWQVYPPETIVAEKLHALMTLGSLNSRSKDIFDIDLLLKQVDPESLKLALNATFAFRKTQKPSSLAKASDEIERSVLRRGWKGSVGFMKNAPDFDRTFDSVISWLEEHQM